MKNILLAVNGRLLADICCTQPADPVQRFARYELRRYLYLCLGARRESGSSAFIVLDSAASTGDGFKIFLADNTLHILGNNPRSLLFGVYAFLKRFCGCSFPAPGIDVVLRKDNLVVSLNKPWRETPSFNGRHVFPEEGPFTLLDLKKLIDWAPKNCINGFTTTFMKWEKYGNVLRPALKRRGLSLCLAGHAMSMFIPKRESQKHPDWFALRETRRTPDGQYCFSSVSLRHALAQRIRDFIAKEHILASISLWAEDNAVYCQCKLCRKKGFMKSYSSFVNELAKEIHTHAPSVKVAFSVYNAGLAWDMFQPQQGLSRSNLSTEIAYWGRQYEYPVAHSPLAADRRAVACLKTWKRICGEKLIPIEYYTDTWMAATLLPPLPDVMQKDLMFYSKIGIVHMKSLMVLATYPGGLGKNILRFLAGTMEPNLYFFSRLLWNPAQSAKRLVRDYCRAMYGADEQLCGNYLFAMERIFSRVYSFNRSLFRLRFTDVWMRDTLWEEGGIQFSPSAWKVDQPLLPDEIRRVRVARRIVNRMERFEDAHPWQTVENDGSVAMRVMDFRSQWRTQLGRVRAIWRQSAAQCALSKGNFREARGYLASTLSTPEFLSKTESRICERWLKHCLRLTSKR